MADKQKIEYSRTYSFTLKIKGKEYSNELNSVRIVSNLASAWPVFSLDLFILPDDILLESLHGQEDISLICRLLHYDGQEIGKLDFNLMCLKPSSQLPVSKQMMSEGYAQVDRTRLSILAVPKDPYKTLTKMVNGVYGGLSSYKSSRQVAQDLVSKASSTTKLVYDSNGENKEVITQVCIFPNTLYSALQYLDKNFGTHDGCPSIYCRYDNELHIINESDRIKKSPLIIVTHLAIDKKDTEQTIKDASDGVHFYTTTAISVDHKTNSSFAKLGKTIKHVVKPKDKLFHVINTDLEKICKEYGAISGNDKIHMNTGIERDKYYTGDTGYEYSETFIRSMLAKQIFGLSSITLNLEKSLKIENLLKVGECVTFNTDTIEYIDLSGNYILQMSDIKFNRDGKEWRTTVQLKMVRTNKVK